MEIKLLYQHSIAPSSETSQPSMLHIGVDNCATGAGTVMMGILAQFRETNSLISSPKKCLVQTVCCKLVIALEFQSDRILLLRIQILMTSYCMREAHLRTFAHLCHSYLN